LLTETEKRRVILTHVNEQVEFWQLLANSVKYGFTKDGVESVAEIKFQRALSGFVGLQCIDELRVLLLQSLVAHRSQAGSAESVPPSSPSLPAR
jgi:hypothetical protein